MHQSILDTSLTLIRIDVCTKKTKIATMWETWIVLTLTWDDRVDALVEQWHGWCTEQRV